MPGVTHVPSALRNLVVSVPNLGIRPVDAVVASAYVVSVLGLAGILTVRFTPPTVPIVLAEFHANVAALLLNEYVVLSFGGTTHVPSALRYLVVPPPEAGASPAAADVKVV